MLRSWLQRTPSGGRLPDEAQKTRLRSRLAAAGLDEATTRQLMFYARL